jgi:hypothetical protein
MKKSSVPILQRRLVSGDEAEKMQTQHKKPCADCPFARTALPGWLGSMTVPEWLIAIHYDASIDCHCTTNMQCAGAAIFRANVCKIPHSTQLKLEPDRQLVFARDQEFIDHHTKKPRKLK